MLRPSKRLLNLTRSGKGFTLTELLIALAILGVIATFTIPKVLQAQQDNSYRSVAKESAAAISQAFQVANLAGKSPAAVGDITPYLNYIAKDTTSTVATDATYSCADFVQCYKLHNGATLYFYPWVKFCSTEPTAVGFAIVPNSQNLGGENTVHFLVYRTGRITSYDNYLTGTVWNDVWVANGSCTAHASWWSRPDPSWFSWN